VERASRRRRRTRRSLLEHFLELPRQLCGGSEFRTSAAKLRCSPRGAQIWTAFKISPVDIAEFNLPKLKRIKEINVDARVPAREGACLFIAGCASPSADV
jgi:hypothetical protein